MSSKIHDLNLICFFIQDEALSPQSQPSPLSVCSESSGFSEISSPPRKAAKRTNQVVRGEAASATTRLLAIQLFSIFRDLLFLHHSMGLQNSGMSSPEKKKSFKNNL